MARVAIIGGGAAGLMAAARAAETGARVLLLEKTHRLGSKLRLTGGGHANVTHEGGLEELLDHMPINGAWVRQAITRFDNAALCGLLADLGQPTYTDSSGRIFPQSRNAHQVAKALRTLCLRQGVQFRYDSPVKRILLNHGRVSAVLADRKIAADAVVLATGGASYPETGSDGSGYDLARQIGHTIQPLRPGLCALYSRDVEAAELQGVRLPQAKVVLREGEREVARVVGDLLFTDKGLSGPAAHNASLHLVRPTHESNLCLAFAQDTASAERAVRLGMARAPRKHWLALLPRAIPQRLGLFLAQRAGIAPTCQAGSLTDNQVLRVARLLWRLDYQIMGCPPLEHATVTVGGVSVGEVEPSTMASHLIPGLYFGGEVLDVTGESGGYNLQVAFSTGRLAGESAARYLLSMGAA